MLHERDFLRNNSWFFEPQANHENELGTEHVEPSSISDRLNRKACADAGPGVWRAWVSKWIHAFQNRFSEHSSARRNAGPRLVCADLEISISTYFSLHCLTYKISTIVLCFFLAYFL